MRAALLALAVSGALLVACRARESEISSAAPTPAATAAGTASNPTTLVGRWLRADSNYTIDVAGVSADGSVEAKYFNPQPIHVSGAAWRNEDGRLALFVEMTDRGYPGNFYTLLYDPGSDSLSGVYNHVGLNQTFDVAFSRIR